MVFIHRVAFSCKHALININFCISGMIQSDQSNFLYRWLPVHQPDCFFRTVSQRDSSPKVVFPVSVVPHHIDKPFLSIFTLDSNESITNTFIKMELLHTTQRPWHITPVSHIYWMINKHSRKPFRCRHRNIKPSPTLTHSHYNIYFHCINRGYFYRINLNHDKVSIR